MDPEKGEDLYDHSGTAQALQPHHTGGALCDRGGAAGGLAGAGVILLQTVYLPRPGLTLRDLHAMVEKMESMLKGLKLFVVLYAAIVVAALLAAMGFTNFYLTKVLLGWAAGSWRSRT